MRQFRLLAGAGAAAFLLAVIVMLPARVVLSGIGLPPGLVSHVAGTIWRGSAGRVSLGSLAFGPVSWSALPARLLTGQLAADFDATVPDGFAKGRVALALGNRVTLRDLTAAAPLSWLAPGVAAGGGQLTTRFEQLTIRAGRVTSAVGKLELAGVVLPIPTTGPQLGPGTYAVTFAADNLAADQPLTGELKDAGGPLEIAGTVTITPPRSYEVSGTAKPRPGAPPELRDALQMLGPATPDGGHVLSLAGTF
ncbi:MAG: type II secretion system protein N [Gammaproteobacteria bacterium]